MKPKRDVVAALIWQGNRFMICQRPAHKTRAMQWEFVGGKTEENESHTEALIRECHEEIAATIKVNNLFMEVDHEYPDIDITLYLYNCEIADGTVQMLEHNDIRWITPKEIPNYEFCPADKDILAKITEIYGGK